MFHLQLSCVNDVESPFSKKIPNVELQTQKKTTYLVPWPADTVVRCSANVARHSENIDQRSTEVLFNVRRIIFGNRAQVSFIRASSGNPVFLPVLPLNWVTALNSLDQEKAGDWRGREEEA